MTKEEFRAKIESGEAVKFGRYTFQKHGADYCFFGESAEIYESFDELWGRVHSFILHGVDYSRKDKSRNRRLNNPPAGDPPALDYDPRKFNPTSTCEDSVVANYYGPGQDLVLWSNPGTRVTAVNPLAMRADDKQK